MSNYSYAWNISALINWLHEEQGQLRGIHTLSTALRIQPHTLLAWIRGYSTDITFEQLRAISNYKGLSYQQTAAWLGIKPNHWRNLSNQM